jgi:hypothetical protein
MTECRQEIGYLQSLTLIKTCRKVPLLDVTPENQQESLFSKIA